MKRYMKKIWVFVLCLTLCLCNTMPALAANADNVTFSVSLDKQEIQTAGVDQTVVMTLRASSAFTAAGIEFEILSEKAPAVEGESATAMAWEVSAVSAGDNQTNTEWQYNVVGNVYKASWMSASGNNTENIQNIVSVTIVVPAGTVAGNYTLGVEGLEITDEQGDMWENGGTATTTLTITDSTATGYTAGISASENSIEVDDDVNVLVTADHATEEAFAAAEITVCYASSVLSFDAEAFKTSYPNVSADTTVAGTLKLVDHGVSKAFGETGYVYTLPFKATASADNTNVTINYAGFATQTEAETKDLTEAAYNPKSVTLNISEKSLSVTLPKDGILTGADEVAYGGDYTFALADKDNYDYEITKVMMDNTDVTANLVDNGDGTYTITSVTDALEITATRTAKNYTVTIEGTGKEDVKAADGIEAAATTATYGQAYIFTTPINSAEYSYETAVTIGGSVYTGTGSESGEALVTYTISGEAVTGDIVITVTKTKLTADEVAVTIPSGVDVTGEEKVAIGQPYTLTLTEEAGYVYEVTATMGGETAEPTKGTDADGKTTYTISAVTGAIVFNVAKTVDTGGVTVSQYVTLDSTIMWLVENTTAVAEGKVPTYDGQNMFWSSKYGTDAENDGTNDGAYCYLVISNENADNVLAAAKAAVGIAAGSAEAVAYDNDVNETGKVDASDAQLAWNMYNSVYKNFTAEVTVAKFLEADVNGNKIVNMDDAAAVVAAALARTE